MEHSDPRPQTAARETFTSSRRPQNDAMHIPITVGIEVCSMPWGALCAALRTGTKLDSKNSGYVSLSRYEHAAGYDPDAAFDDDDGFDPDHGSDYRTITAMSGTIIFLQTNDAVRVADVARRLDAADIEALVWGDDFGNCKVALPFSSSLSGEHRDRMVDRVDRALGRILTPRYPERLESTPIVMLGDVVYRVHGRLIDTRSDLDADGESAPVASLSHHSGFRRSRPIRQAQWAIRDIVAAHGVHTLFGQPGSLKTAMAIDMAMAMATGAPWCGHSTIPGLRVGMLAAEDPPATWRLLDAARIDRGLAELPFDVLDCDDAAINLYDEYVAAEVQHRVSATGGLDVLVIDTLSRVMDGGDENSGADMLRVLGRARKLAKCVLLVHHSGKEVARGERGSSVLRAEVSAALELTRKNDVSTFRVVKVRSAGTTGLAYHFRSRVIDIGAGETSVVVEQCDAPTQSSSKRGAPPAGANVEVLMRYLTERKLGGDPMRVDDVIKGAISAGVLNGKPRQKALLRQAVRGAKNQGLVVVSDDNMLTCPAIG
jgi:hypothetical protein